MEKFLLFEKEIELTVVIYPYNQQSPNQIRIENILNTKRQCIYNNIM